MPHRAPPDERFRNLRHRNGALHPRGRAQFFQRILERQRIDNRRQHPHVIARGAFNAAFTAAQPAKNIAAADHHDHLHPEVAHFANLLRHALHRIGVNANARFTTQHFTAQLEENPRIDRTFDFGFRHRCMKISE